jgi:hypothetical protein
MARRNISEDQTTLQMALVGYRIEQQRIEDKIRELQAQLKGKTAYVSATTAAKPARAKRELSPAARKRIGVAQKKRWAEHRKRLAQAAKEA